MFPRLKLILLPPANEVWGKVIFLHPSVILFTGGSTLAGTPLAGTPPKHVHTPLRQVPPAGTHPTWQVPPAGTPSLAGTPPAVHAGIRSTSGRYASYWNAFFF